MEQVLNRRIPVRLYCENGVAVEGMRGQIMIHPIYIQRAEEILEDLRGWLPRLRDTPTAEFPPVSVDEENRLVEQGIREYPTLGSAKTFLDRYPRVPPAAKRRIHKAIVDGHRATYGKPAKDLSEERLKTLYPDE